MGSFKTFLNENEEALTEINAILIDLEADEIDELGHVLYDSFFDTDPDNKDNDTDEADVYYTVDDLHDMIESLGEDMYVYILELLEIADEDPDEIPVSHQQSPDVNEEEEDTSGMTDEEIAEGVSRRLTMKNMNKKKRKFMGKSKADLRKTRATRKKAARTNRASRKRYQRANKNKIKSYQKSRSAAIAKGKHKVKLRRKA